MTGRALIICVSVHHGNTAAVARAMASALGAEVREPEEVEPHTLAQYDVVGFGSGIFYATHHPRLRGYVEHLPLGNGRRAFVFTTAGLGRAQSWWGQRPLTTVLENKGYDVVGSFACRGFEDWWPLSLVGGLDKGHPNAQDLSRAFEFAHRVGGDLPAHHEAA